MSFVLAEHASRQAGISETELRRLDDTGIVSGVEKNGLVFYSSREIYRLKAILFLARSRDISIDQAAREFNQANADRPVASAPAR